MPDKINLTAQLPANQFFPRIEPNCEALKTCPELVGDGGYIKLPVMAPNLSTYAIDAVKVAEAHRGLEVMHEALKGVTEEGNNILPTVRDRMLRRLVRAMNVIRALDARVLVSND